MPPLSTNYVYVHTKTQKLKTSWKFHMHFVSNLVQIYLVSLKGQEPSSRTDIITSFIYIVQKSKHVYLVADIYNNGATTLPSNKQKGHST